MARLTTWPCPPPDKHTLNPQPQPLQEGWILEFDAPLTRARHDLVVLFLAQVGASARDLGRADGYTHSHNAQAGTCLKSGKVPHPHHHATRPPTNAPPPHTNTHQPTMLFAALPLQLNRAVDILPDLTPHWREFEPKLKELEAQRDAGTLVYSNGVTSGFKGTHPEPQQRPQ